MSSTTLINLLLKTQKYQEVLEYIDKALQLSPDSLFLIYTKAFVYRSLKYVDKALHWFS